MGLGDRKCCELVEESEKLSVNLSSVIEMYHGATHTASRATHTASRATHAASRASHAASRAVHANPWLSIASGHCLTVCRKSQEPTITGNLKMPKGIQRWKMAFATIHTSWFVQNLPDLSIPTLQQHIEALISPTASGSRYRIHYHTDFVVWLWHSSPTRSTPTSQYCTCSA